MAKQKSPAPPPTGRQRDPWAEHRRWLARAQQIATAPVSRGGSTHPSVHVGAVLIDAKGREVAAASNRFAQGVDRRRPERFKNGSKSLWSNCAEQMLLMQVLRQGKKTAGARLYVTLEPCAVCAGMIGELRIGEVYVPVDAMRRYAKLKSKWKNSIEIGMTKLAESGTRLISVDTREAAPPRRKKNRI